MKKLVIFGTKNFAEVAHYYFERDTSYQVAAFTVDPEHVREDTYRSLPVVPFTEIERSHPPERHDLFVALGIRLNNSMRERKVAEAEAKGYSLATFLASKAIVPPNLDLHPNTWIMDAVHIYPFSTIGRNTIIWAGTSIGFRSTIGDNCWFAAGIFGERVTIGNNTFVGLGATVSSFVSVGKCNVIGAGALLLKDTKDFEVYRGNASKPSRVPSTRLRNFNG